MGINKDELIQSINQHRIRAYAEALDRAASGPLEKEDALRRGQIVFYDMLAETEDRLSNAVVSAENHPETTQALYEALLLVRYYRESLLKQIDSV